MCKYTSRTPSVDMHDSRLRVLMKPHSKTLFGHRGIPARFVGCPHHSSCVLAEAATRDSGRLIPYKLDIVLPFNAVLL